MNVLASDLPYSHHENSSLVCRQSGERVDEHNPPMMLPNGCVYSQHSLEAMVLRDGIITCPQTGSVFEMHEAKRVYIM